jgi:predicted GH43/DUF377 family glycosyl hydrolase
MSDAVLLKQYIPFLNVNLNNYKYWRNPVLSPQLDCPWEAKGIGRVAIIKVTHTDWHLWYSGISVNGQEAIGYARSTDGINWQRVQSDPVLTATEDWEGNFLDVSSVILNGNTFYLYYWSPGHYDPPRIKRIGLATSTDGIHWTKKGIVLDEYPAILNEASDQGGSGVDAAKVFYLEEERKWVMIFTAFGTTNVWNGLAESLDGIHWRKTHAPLYQGDGCLNRKGIGFHQNTLRGVQRIGSCWVAISSSIGSDQREVFMPAVADSLTHWHRLGTPCVYQIPDGEHDISVLAMIPDDEWYYIYYGYTDAETGRRSLGLITAPKISTGQPIVIWQDAEICKNGLISKILDLDGRHFTCYLHATGEATCELSISMSDEKWEVLNTVTLTSSRLTTINPESAVHRMRLQVISTNADSRITCHIVIAK